MREREGEGRSGALLLGRGEQREHLQGCLAHQKPPTRAPGIPHDLEALFLRRGEEREHLIGMVRFGIWRASEGDMGCVCEGERGGERSAVPGLRGTVQTPVPPPLHAN